MSSASHIAFQSFASFVASSRDITETINDKGRLLDNRGEEVRKVIDSASILLDPLNECLITLRNLQALEVLGNLETVLKDSLTFSRHKVVMKLKSIEDIIKYFEKRTSPKNIHLSMCKHSIKYKQEAAIAEYNALAEAKANHALEANQTLQDINSMIEEHSNSLKSYMSLLASNRS